MSIFVLGLLLFFGIHCISIVNDPWRNRMVDKIGKWTWKGLYSIVSIFGFIMMVWGYGITHYDTPTLYSPLMPLQHSSVLLLLPVFPLLIAAYFPGRIKKLTKHPMLIATMLWATAHLFSNGSLVDVILFGSFLIWAIVDRISLQRRQLRPTPGAPHTVFNDIIACIAGLGLYVAFIFWLHELIIGTSVF